MFKVTDRTGSTLTIELADVVFTFRTQILPGAEWERLLLAHRPKHDGFDYDPETFPPAAIEASVTGWTINDGTPQDYDRAMTSDEAFELWSEWPQWARRRLLTTIELQNVTGRALGKANGRRNSTPATATTATG